MKINEGQNQKVLYISLSEQGLRYKVDQQYQENTDKNKVLLITQSFTDNCEHFSGYEASNNGPL